MKFWNYLFYRIKFIIQWDKTCKCGQFLLHKQIIIMCSVNKALKDMK